jgi:hypothetical protein
MKKRLAIALVALVVASCGRVADLQPQAGKSLPQKPALAARALTAEELLQRPTDANPRRVDELSKRGDVRQADRFDLPPPNGDAVPPPAAEPATQQEPQD